MLENDLLMTCSHELHAEVKTTPSVFQNSKYRCILSTSIILNWSHKECIVVAVVFKWVEDAFALRPLLGPLPAARNKCCDQITIPRKQQPKWEVLTTSHLGRANDIDRISKINDYGREKKKKERILRCGFP